MKCFSCGKEMSNEQGESVIGFQLDIDIKKCTLLMVELLKSSLGKYYTDGELEYIWAFCYECWLNSLCR